MTATIPILDLAKFETADANSAARELDKICCEIGFLVIKNHNIPTSIQDSLYKQGRKFFRWNNSIYSKNNPKAPNINRPINKTRLIICFSGYEVDWL